MTRCVRCSGEMSALTVFCPQCQHPNEPDFRHLIHQTLDNRFQLYRQLNEGGLSTIFAAIDLQTDKTVVVKVSDPRHLTQASYNSPAERLEARQYWTEMTERMQREVAALTHLHHPHIVRVFAAGAISDDLTYVVMELLRGKTLREELTARGRLPINEAVALAAEVAAGLSIIHARGIVHRDLTPRNIFLLQKDERGGVKDEFDNPTSSLISHPSSLVKLIDFGIAKFPKPPGAQTYTQHAIMTGTPGYASPEQFQNLAVDHRADIYSLGVVLYELVTGEKPFVGRTATEIAVKQLRDEPVRPRALVPDLPLRLEALILRALAKDPAVRQQSADELAAELKTISTRVEVPLFAPAAVPVPLIREPEPSGSEVFTLLSDLVAKPEPATAPAIVEPKSAEVEQVVIEPLPEITFSEPRQRQNRRWLVAAGLALLFVVGTWGALVLRGGPETPVQTFAPTSAPSESAIPTPTLRPDITAPRTTARTTTARATQPELETPIVKTSALPVPTSAPKARPQPVASVPARKTPAVTPRATATPVVIAARMPTPTPPVIAPPIKMEPTPTPAPPDPHPGKNPTPAPPTAKWCRARSTRRSASTSPVRS